MVPVMKTSWCTLHPPCSVPVTSNETVRVEENATFLRTTPSTGNMDTLEKDINASNWNREGMDKERTQPLWIRSHSGFLFFLPSFLRTYSQSCRTG